jgi:hypothetical protein
MPPRQDNDFMDVDSDSDISIIGDSTRGKGRAKGKVSEKRKKNKGKGKVKDVGHTPQSNNMVLIDYTASLHLGGIVYTILGYCTGG